MIRAQRRAVQRTFAAFKKGIRDSWLKLRGLTWLKSVTPPVYAMPAPGTQRVSVVGPGNVPTKQFDILRNLPFLNFMENYAREIKVPVDKLKFTLNGTPPEELDTIKVSYEAVLVHIQSNVNSVQENYLLRADRSFRQLKNKFLKKHANSRRIISNKVAFFYQGKKVSDESTAISLGIPNEVTVVAKWKLNKYTKTRTLRQISIRLRAISAQLALQNHTLFQDIVPPPANSPRPDLSPFLLTETLEPAQPSNPPEQQQFEPEEEDHEMSQSEEGNGEEAERDGGSIGQNEEEQAENEFTDMKQQITVLTTSTCTINGKLQEVILVDDDTAPSPPDSDLPSVPLHKQ